MTNTILPCSSLEVTHDALPAIVTKAPPINSIDSKCHTEKLKGSRTCLIGYSDFISREGPGVGHFFVVNTRGWIQTDRQTHFESACPEPPEGW